MNKPMNEILAEIDAMSKVRQSIIHGHLQDKIAARDRELFQLLSEDILIALGKARAYWLYF